MRQKPFVSAGPEFMGWAADRHLHFDVDSKIARKYNENYHSDRNFYLGFLFFGMLMFGVCVWLFSGASIWKIIISIICAILGLATFGLGVLGMKRAGTPSAMLKRGILNPAIIAKIDNDGIGVLVLAETDKGWAIKSMRLKNLPPVHEKNVGELIPVTCTIDCYTAALIAWGTNSKEVIKVAVDGIDNIEWSAIKKLIDRYDFKTEYNEEQLIKYLDKEDVNNLDLYKISSY